MPLNRTRKTAFFSSMPRNEIEDHIPVYPSSYLKKLFCSAECVTYFGVVRDSYKRFKLDKLKIVKRCS